jgi:hypothetical protein
VCPFGLTYIQSVGAIGNTFGEHIGDTWGHTGNIVGTK